MSLPHINLHTLIHIHLLYCLMPFTHTYTHTIHKYTTSSYYFVYVLSLADLVSSTFFNKPVKRQASFIPVVLTDLPTARLPSLV